MWDGVIFCRSGIYKNGIFRFALNLEEKFPSQKNPPQIKLLTPLLHPLIHEETLVFDSSPAFPSGWSESDHIYELLKFFKYALENIDYCSHVATPANANAVELLNNDRQKFLEISRDAAARSVSEIFNSNTTDESHFFAFDKSIVEDGLQEQILENMKSLSDSCDSFSFSFDRRG